MRLSLPLSLLAWLFLGFGGLACGGDDPLPSNKPPTLTGPTAQPTAVSSGSPVSLTLEASDPDGDVLTFAWTQVPASPAGTFTNISAPAPSWTAPVVSASQRFALRVSVSDGRGGTEQGSVDVDVAPPVPQNTPPTLSTPTATATTIDEQQALTLAVSGSDVDGDPLTYSWEQAAPATPRGTFDNAASTSPVWTAPDVTSSGTYTLRVTVTDGRGGSAQSTIDIAVQKVNRPPVVAATISGPTTLVAGVTGTFSITASDADGDPLTYSWTQTAPASSGTWVGARTGSSAQWYSPVVATQTSFTFSVSVTDGESTSVVRTVTLPVSVPRYSANVQGIWTSVPCTGCHGSNGGLNLGSGSSYSNLVNVTANACGPAKRVAPGDPGNSALIRKLEGTTCGSRMPRNNPTYFDQQPGLFVLIRSWILAGAAND